MPVDVFCFFPPVYVKQKQINNYKFNSVITARAPPPLRNVRAPSREARHQVGSLHRMSATMVGAKGQEVFGVPVLKMSTPRKFGL